MNNKNINNEALLIYKLVDQILGNGILNTYTEDFSSRLMVQKAIYISQEISKKNFGGDFSWYLNGPYSPSLSRIIYKHIIPDLPMLFVSKIELNETGQKLVQSTTTFFEYDYQQLGLTKSKWYELIASVHYLSKENKTTNAESLTQMLFELKPHFSKEQIRQAIRIYLEEKRELFN
jgi:uncharacterized protein YwgA